MATSGTYVTEVPLKGTAEKHYKRWKSENFLFPDAIGHHIQNVTVHDGEWDSHGGIKIWNYTLCIHLFKISYIQHMWVELYTATCVTVMDIMVVLYTAQVTILIMLRIYCIISYEYDQI